MVLSEFEAKIIAAAGKGSALRLNHSDADLCCMASFGFLDRGQT